MVRGHRPSQRLVPRPNHQAAGNQDGFQFPPPPTVADPEDRSIQARFETFHDRHPEVYRELVRLARQWVDRTDGRKLGIGMLWEVLRWNLSTRADSDEPYKLNNVYRSRYARLLMAREPDLAGVFNTRELTSR